MTGEGGTPDGDSLWEWIQPSKVQAEFPNKKHQKAVSDLIGSCPNLEGLCVNGTHFLGPSELESLGPRGLRILCVERVYTSLSSIQKLIHPHPTSDTSPQLHCITMTKVKVRANSRNWSNFFTYLRQPISRVNKSRGTAAHILHQPPLLPTQHDAKEDVQNYVDYEA